jgi:hypothetical protein
VEAVRGASLERYIYPLVPSINNRGGHSCVTNYHREWPLDVARLSAGPPRCRRSDLDVGARGLCVRLVHLEQLAPPPGGLAA